MPWYMRCYMRLCRRFPWWVFFGRLGRKPVCKSQIVVLNYYKDDDTANCTIVDGHNPLQYPRRDFPAALLRKRKIKPLGSFWWRGWPDGHILPEDIVLRDNMDLLSDADRLYLQHQYYPECFGTQAAMPA